jgi:uncharacterized membrane protein YkvA (DUF1232 family)
MSIISQIVDWVSTPYTVYLIFKDRSIPRSVKIRAAAGLVLMFVYVVSPFDIIPDFIPFAGWLDDLIIVPLGFTALRIFTPGFDVVEKRNHAEKRVKRILIWVILAITAWVLLFLASLGLLIYIIVRLISG